MLAGRLAPSVGVRCPCAADAACAVLARHGLPTAAVGVLGAGWNPRMLV